MQNKFQHKLAENNLSKKPYTIFEKKKIILISLSRRPAPPNRELEQD